MTNHKFLKIYPLFKLNQSFSKKIISFVHSIYSLKYNHRTLFFSSDARLRLRIRITQRQTGCWSATCSEQRTQIGSSRRRVERGSSSHSACGQDLFDRLSPVALTTDSDAERFFEHERICFDNTLHHGCGCARASRYATRMHVCRRTSVSNARSCQIAFVL